VKPLTTARTLRLYSSPSVIRCFFTDGGQTTSVDKRLATYLRHLTAGSTRQHAAFSQRSTIQAMSLPIQNDNGSKSLLVLKAIITHKFLFRPNGNGPKSSHISKAQPGYPQVPVYAD
jgi:hypothetical protein